MKDTINLPKAWVEGLKHYTDNVDKLKLPVEVDRECHINALLGYLKSLESLIE